MKNLTIITLDDNKAQVSKTFAKRAVIFGTEEYKLWREYKKDFPAAEMITKTIKRNPTKKTNKNMTYENMEIFMKELSDCENIKKEYERIKELAKVSPSPYRVVLTWFENKFKDTEEYKKVFIDTKINEDNTSEKANA